MTEKEMSEKTGVDIRELKKLRAAKMVKGRDWELTMQGISYSKDGEGLMMALLGLAGPAKEPAPAGAGVLPQKTVSPSTGILAIVTGHCRRADLVLAELNGQEIRIRGRAKKADRFVPGMEVSVRQVDPETYEVVDGRVPRKRGAW